MKNEDIKLSNQLCHPLYSAANALVRVYGPILEGIDLTYPQYIVMMALWEKDGVNLKTLSEATFFDSGSLTPLIKRLMDKGLIKYTSAPEDQRQKIIYLTKKGEKLSLEAGKIPELMMCQLQLTMNEFITLKNLTEKLRRNLNQS